MVDGGVRLVLNWNKVSYTKRVDLRHIQRMESSALSYTICLCGRRIFFFCHDVDHFVLLLFFVDLLGPFGMGGGC